MPLNKKQYTFKLDFKLKTLFIDFFIEETSNNYVKQI